MHAAPRWSIPPQTPVAAADTRLAGALDRGLRNRGQRLLHRGPRQRAFTQDVPATMGVELAQVDDGGGCAWQLASVEHELRSLAQPARHLGERAGVGLAGEVGAGLHDRNAHGSQSAQALWQSRYAQAKAPRIRPACSGEVTLAVWQQEGHRARQQRLQREALGVAQLRERPQGGLEREEHHRARTRRWTPLEGVQAAGRRLVLRVAAQAIDRVGRKHRDPPARDALLQPQRIALDERVAHAPARSPTTTRSTPARSGSTRTLPKPASAIRRATAPAWPAPTSSASICTRR